MRILKYTGIFFLTLFIALFLLGGGVFLYFVSKAPALSDSKLVATTSSKIYDNNNELIADLGSERRVNAQANEIPTDLVKAIVSIETIASLTTEGSIRFGLWGHSYVTYKVILYRGDQP